MGKKFVFKLIILIGISGAISTARAAPADPVQIPRTGQINNAEMTDISEDDSKPRVSTSTQRTESSSMILQPSPIISESTPLPFESSSNSQDTSVSLSEWSSNSQDTAVFLPESSSNSQDTAVSLSESSPNMAEFVIMSEESSNFPKSDFEEQEVSPNLINIDSASSDSSLNLGEYATDESEYLANRSELPELAKELSPELLNSDSVSSLTSEPLDVVKSQHSDSSDLLNSLPDSSTVRSLSLSELSRIITLLSSFDNQGASQVDTLDIPQLQLYQSLLSKRQAVPIIEINNEVEYRPPSLGGVSSTPTTECSETCQVRDKVGICRLDHVCLSNGGQMLGQLVDSQDRSAYSIIKSSQCPMCYRSDMSGKCRLMLTCLFTRR